MNAVTYTNNNKNKNNMVVFCWMTKSTVSFIVDIGEYFILFLTPNVLKILYKTYIYMHLLAYSQKVNVLHVVLFPNTVY